MITKKEVRNAAIDLYIARTIYELNGKQENSKEYKRNYQIKLNSFLHIYSTRNEQKTKDKEK